MKMKILYLSNFINLIIFQGQSESKKQAKRSGLETKGTAMSFGFKKKLYTTSKKKSATAAATAAIVSAADYNQENEMEVEKLTNREEKYRQATVINNAGLSHTDNACGDDNGNKGITSVYGYI